MKEYDSVLAMKDYGKISIKLDKIMDAQNITRNKLASLTGVRFEVIDCLYRRFGADRFRYSGTGLLCPEM